MVISHRSFYGAYSMKDAHRRRPDTWSSGRPYYHIDSYPTDPFLSGSAHQKECMSRCKSVRRHQKRGPRRGKIQRGAT